MGYNICLFDLDGTLTDPKLGITKSFQYALSVFGIGEELDNLTKFIGPSLHELFRDFYGFSDIETEKGVVKYREYFTETGLYENTVCLDILEALRKLKVKGKTLAIATSKVTTYANQIFEHFNLGEYFSFVSGDEKTVRSQ